MSGLLIKMTRALLMLMLALSVAGISSHAMAGDYRLTEPGSGIGKTAHDLRPGTEANGWDYRSLYQKMYDLRTMVTLEGIVTAVEQVAPHEGMSPGTALTVSTGEGVISVHLGPSWFIRTQDIHFETGTPVAIRGSRVSNGNIPIIMAAEIKTGDRTVTLRDRNGFPLWPGRMKR